MILGSNPRSGGHSRYHRGPMRTLRRALTALPAIPVAVTGVLVVQVMRAAHRSDLPSYPNQDPSGTFGNPDLPPLRIVALGDSSITAPGIEDLDNTWVRRVAIALSKQHRVELISVAVGGSKARHVIESQLAAAIKLEPDIAILSVGANDAIRGSSPSRYREETRRILSDLEQACGAVVVIGVGDLGSIPRLPTMLRPFLTWCAARFDRAAAAAAAEFQQAVKVPTVGPMSTAFWEDPGLFAGDQFHVGEEGHAIFADQVLPSVRAALAIAGRP